MPISEWGGAEILCRQTQNRRTRLPVHPCRREHVVQTLTCCTRTQLRADSKFSCSTRGLSPIIPGVLFRLPRVRSFARTQKKRKERKGKEKKLLELFFILRPSWKDLQTVLYILKMLFLEKEWFLLYFSETR